MSSITKYFSKSFLPVEQFCFVYVQVSRNCGNGSESFKGTNWQVNSTSIPSSWLDTAGASFKVKGVLSKSHAGVSSFGTTGI